MDRRGFGKEIVHDERIVFVVFTWLFVSLAYPSCAYCLVQSIYWDLRLLNVLYIKEHRGYSLP
jgi:hypothetical protein